MSDDWPSTGTLLATRYRLVTLLETGGMAEIWHARDELLGRPVAVKLPTGPQVAWREARMAAKLSHPNIAAVHDYREAVRADGTVAPFVVMELLAGETVASRLEREAFDWPEAARVGAAVADALAAAHACGVVHRDIKPGNVMLTPNGTKILDFGISAAAGEPDDDDTGSTFGTPAYVAPERLDGMPAEPATDVYGVGVLLFEMVTGDPPYPVDTWEELAEARRHGPRTLPESLPEPFRAVVERCLADDPNRRPHADQIRFDLTALWLAETGGQEGEHPAAERTTEHSFFPVIIPARRNRPTGSRTREEFMNTAVRPRPQAAGAPVVEAHRAAREEAEPAETPPVTDPRPQQRRLALALTVLAVVVAAGGAYVVSSRARDRTVATPSTPMAEPVRPLYTLEPPPTAASPSAAVALAPARPSPPTPATTSKPPPVTISYDDAYARLRAVVEQGKTSKQLRPDVATDLLNFVTPLQNAKAADVDRRIAALRRKINDRAREGALSPARATQLRARVSDLERAAGA
jgi:eukaryotic-like serine/threonine-protein kinase